MVEHEAPAWGVRAQEIFLDPLGIRAELHRVNSLGIVKVVVDLVRIPTEFKGSGHNDPSGKSGKIVAYGDRVRPLSGIKTILRISRRGIGRFGAVGRCRIVTIEPHAERIQQLRRENVAPFKGKGLAFTLVADELVIHLIRLGLVGIVEQIGSEDPVLVREDVIRAEDDEILSCNLVALKRIGPRGTGRPKSLQIQNGSRVRGRPRVVRCQSCRRSDNVRSGGHGSNHCRAQDLPDTLIVAKNECLIFLNRASGGTSKLIPAKGWLRVAVYIINEICRVQRFVAKELVYTAMEIVGTRLGNRADDPARGSSILR